MASPWSPLPARWTHPRLPAPLSDVGQVNGATLGAYIFFADLATSFWFGILLAVSAGYWCAGAVRQAGMLLLLLGMGLQIWCHLFAQAAGCRRHGKGHGSSCCCAALQWVPSCLPKTFVPCRLPAASRAPPWAHTSLWSLPSPLSTWSPLWCAGSALRPLLVGETKL